MNSGLYFHHDIRVFKEWSWWVPSAIDLAMLSGSLGPRKVSSASALVGSAAMFGFERLVAAGGKFERAAQSDAAETSVLASQLCAVVEATLTEIRDAQSRLA